MLLTDTGLIYHLTYRLSILVWRLGRWEDYKLEIPNMKDEATRKFSISLEHHFHFLVFSIDERYERSIRDKVFKEAKAMVGTY